AVADGLALAGELVPVDRPAAGEALVDVVKERQLRLAELVAEHDLALAVAPAGEVDQPVHDRLDLDAEALDVSDALAQRGVDHARAGQRSRGALVRVSQLLLATQQRPVDFVTGIAKLRDRHSQM